MPMIRLTSASDWQKSHEVVAGSLFPFSYLQVHRQCDNPMSIISLVSRPFEVDMERAEKTKTMPATNLSQCLNVQRYVEGATKFVMKLFSQL